MISFTKLEGKNVKAVAEQGSTWLFTVQIKDSGGNPVDITGWQFRSQIRKTPNSPSVVAEFNISILDAQNGIIEVRLDADKTANITAGMDENDEKGLYYFDLEFEKPDGYVGKLIRGTINVIYEVTK